MDIKLINFCSGDEKNSEETKLDVDLIIILCAIAKMGFSNAIKNIFS
jgi:hypothetical protein